MSLWFLSSPEATAAFVVGRAQRAQTAARLAYLAIDGIARLGAAAVGGTAELFARAVASLARARRRRAAINELAALDDRNLKDIGLSRGDIPSVVSELLDSAPRTRIRTLPRQHAAASAAGVAHTPAAGNDNRPARAA